MAIIKSAKARELSDAELQSRLFDYQKELNTERGVLAAGGRASNTGKIKQLRKSVARVLTIMHERLAKASASAPLAHGRKPEKKLGIASKADAPAKKEEKK
jgi:large subunit ribosomal protein L29